jgi:tRNA(Ile)-lysidine synthase
MANSPKGPKKNRLLKTVKQAITRYKMFEPKDSVLVGVSGGPDSIALLYSLLALSHTFPITIGVAHFNHTLRGKDSDRDAAFVADIAKKLALPFYEKKRDTLAFKRKEKLSLEEAARHLRYDFLLNTAKEYKFDKIALGHNLEDNAELILMYLFRGSGLSGVSGIPAVRDAKIVRPLILSSRPHILDFIAQEGLKHVTDSSNADRRYLRNRVRHDLIPMLKESYNPNIADTLVRFGSILESEDKWIEKILDPVFEKAVCAKQADMLTLSTLELGVIHIAAQRRIIRRAIKHVKGDLRRITFTHVDSVINLQKSPTGFGTLDLPDRIMIMLKNKTLIISREKQTLRSITGRNGKPEPISFKYTLFKKEFKPITLTIKETGVTLRFSRKSIGSLSNISHSDKHMAFMDMDKLTLPLVIRNSYSGDRYTPLGMTGTVKISKFFINRKVPRVQRSKCPILLSKDRIILVAGHEIDDSVKVTPSTKNVIKVELFLA